MCKGFPPLQWSMRRLFVFQRWTNCAIFYPFVAVFGISLRDICKISLGREDLVGISADGFLFDGFPCISYLAERGEFFLSPGLRSLVCGPNSTHWPNRPRSNTSLVAARGARNHHV